MSDDQNDLKYVRDAIGLNSCDVKLSQNSKSFNIDIHVYEYATQDRIKAVIENAIFAMKTTQERLAQEFLQK